jgi:hypothetical protein
MNEHDNKNLELVTGRPFDEKNISGMYIITICSSRPWHAMTQIRVGWNEVSRPDLHHD